MSAPEITAAVLKELDQNDYTLVVQNFANTDLVGHSGNLKATIKACEVLDECIGKISKKCLEKGYIFLLSADHGNAEYMIYEENGDPCPSHTLNPVIFLCVSTNYKNIILKNGGLQDVAPTILDFLKIDQPEEMTGRSLLQK